MNLPVRFYHQTITGCFTIVILYLYLLCLFIGMSFCMKCINKCVSFSSYFLLFYSK